MPDFTTTTELRMKRLLIYGMAILTLSACGEKIHPGTTEEKASVTVKAPLAKAQVTHQPVYYEAVGTVTARTASTVSSKLMGVVRTVHVREGDMVKQGDLLVTIDPRQVEAAVTPRTILINNCSRSSRPPSRSSTAPKPAIAKRRQPWTPPG